MVYKKYSWFIGERISGSRLVPIIDNVGNLIAMVYKRKEHGDLIAAAPDMYEALGQIRSRLPGLWGGYVHGGLITIRLDVDTIEKAMNALARAENGNPQAKGVIPYVVGTDTR